MAELDGIRLESTTDTPEQVNDALGISNGQEPPEEPATEDETAETPPASEVPAAPAEAEPTSDDDADEPDDDEAQPRPRRRRNYQKRINELVASRNQEREQREALERRLAALEQRNQSPQAADDDAPDETDDIPAPADGRPNADNFDNYDDYVDALAEYKAEQKVEAALAARDKRDHEAREAQERASREQTWVEKIDAARQRYDDWDEVFSEGTVLVSPAVGEVVQSSDVGADILYHLGQNPDLLQRLNTSSVIQVAKELGRIEAQFTDGAQPPRTQVPAPTPRPAAAVAQPRLGATRPAPLNPVTDTTTSTPKPPGEMDYEEYKAWRANGGGR